MAQSDRPRVAQASAACHTVLLSTSLSCRNDSSPSACYQMGCHCDCIQKEPNRFDICAARDPWQCSEVFITSEDIWAGKPQPRLSRRTDIKTIPLLLHAVTPAPHLIARRRSGIVPAAVRRAEQHRVTCRACLGSAWPVTLCHSARPAFFIPAPSDGRESWAGRMWRLSALRWAIFPPWWRRGAVCASPFNIIKYGHINT